MSTSAPTPPRSLENPVDQCNSHVNLIGTFPLVGLQQLPSEGARQCQAILGHGETLGFWETPQSMIEHFGSQLRCINLRQRLLSALPAKLTASSQLDALLDEGVIWLTRLGLLMRMGPSSLGKNRHKSLDASTIASALYTKFNTIVARGILNRLSTPTYTSFEFAITLTAEDLRELRSSRHTRDHLRRLTELRNRGLWGDAPPAIEFAGNTTSPRGEVAARSPEKESTPYQPIPDEFLAQMGPRVLWIVQVLGPNLIHLLDSLPELIANINFASKTESNSMKMTRSIASYFDANPWRDSAGDTILAPPFPICHGSYRGARRAIEEIDPFEWPIRKWASVATLALTLQSAHLWITLLVMAGRIGEIMTLPRESIEWARDGQPYANGKTYKLAFAINGEERQWPAPEILVDVLAQQVKLIEACEKLAKIRKGIKDEEYPVGVPEHLWASLGSSPRADAEERLAVANASLTRLAMRIGMTATPGGRNLHTHRFRKTLSRLAGLAIDGSPKVLMRLLGHKDITMTLGYMLTDNSFAKEIDDITRELRVMRAQHLIEDMYEAVHKPTVLPYAGHGGLGAPVLSSTVSSYESELHRTGKIWEVETSHELAVLLTNNGQCMRLVNAHVVCTKIDGEIGLCSTKKGIPNIANCQSECINRIEERTGRRDTQRIIPIILMNAQQAIKDNDLLTVASYARQLSIELNRFDDIKENWRDNPEVITIMKAGA